MRAFHSISAALITAATLASASLAQEIFHRGNGGEPGSLDPHQISGTWESNIAGD